MPKGKSMTEEAGIWLTDMYKAAGKKITDLLLKDGGEPIYKERRPVKTAAETRKKQGPGFWQSDIE